MKRMEAQVQWSLASSVAAAFDGDVLNLLNEGRAGCTTRYAGRINFEIVMSLTYQPRALDIIP
jgi:hypothetical protein